MDPFEKARMKPASMLDDAEKDIIKQNADKLTDEDREAFSGFLSSPDDGAGQPDAGAGAPSAGAADAGGDPGTPAGDPTPAPPAPAPDAGQPAGPAPAALSFKTEAELKEYIKKVNAEDAAAKQAAIDAAATPAEKKYVEDTWRPKTWNEGIKTTVDVVMSEIDARQKAQAKAVEENRKKAEADWQALRTEHNLKDVSDPEGLKVHNQIVEIGLKHGKKSFADAYELWSMIPVDKGGGYAIPAPAAQVPPSPSDAGAALAKVKAEKMAAQKAAAAKIGGQTPAAGGAAPTVGSLEQPDYKTLHSAKSVHDLLRKQGVITNNG